MYSQLGKYSLSKCFDINTTEAFLYLPPSPVPPHFLLNWNFICEFNFEFLKPFVQVRKTEQRKLSMGMGMNGTNGTIRAS